MLRGGLTAAPIQHVGDVALLALVVGELARDADHERTGRAPSHDAVQRLAEREVLTVDAAGSAQYMALVGSAQRSEDPLDPARPLLLDRHRCDPALVPLSAVREPV